MRIKPIASNMTELRLCDGTLVLFSYETPVAAFTDKDGYCYTGKNWSATTNRHIGKWFAKNGLTKDNAFIYEQNFFDNLVKGM